LRVNGLRKDAGLTIADRIVLKVWSTSAEVKLMLDEHGETVLADTLATDVDFTEAPEVKHQVTFRVAEQDIWIGF
ncbi:MAG: Isoleucine--tRNA ligase, partial [Patescibacteria group bacterium]|nr:Isoleucine--tRNA ligase [Patescibacteria group bacterium]